jgi:acetyltransferase-like isoleucine patch superfamily enzyme
VSSHVASARRPESLPRPHAINIAGLSPRGHVLWRIGCTIAAILVVETLVCALAVLPVALIWWYLLPLAGWSGASRVLAVAVFAVPSYVLFAVTLMIVSAVTTRALDWHTPVNQQMRVADFDRPLLRWVRSMVAARIVRFFAGALFRGSPIWTAYMRLAGARLGRRVYVNSLAVSDYNLVECGDDVVIGDDVHLSGHTVEDGVVKTAKVRIGSDVTIGLGSVVEIGVVIDDGCQVGALSLVPKFARLAAGSVYVGIPVHPIGPAARSTHNRGRDRGTVRPV